MPSSELAAKIAGAMAALPPPHQVIDDFLSPGVADRMLDQMIGGADAFAPALVREGEAMREDPEIRSSRRLPGRVGVDLQPLVEAVRTRFEALCAAVGMRPFPIHRTECSVVAHGDGDFYKPHLDVRTGTAWSDGDIRVLSCVYYLHRRPAAFSGGELALHGFGKGAPTVRIAPVHNRLAVFPSFVLHEVLPVACPGGAFEDQRFSVNLWVRRTRPDA